jgi:hypothetical protein
VLLVLTGLMVLIVVGGVVWAREWAITDPNLKAYALGLLPENATVADIHPDKCDGSNGWDRFYRPEQTCVEVFWESDRPLEELLDEIGERAEAQGWQRDGVRARGANFQRDGYNALLRLSEPEVVEMCKRTPAPSPAKNRPFLCGQHSVIVRAK